MIKITQYIAPVSNSIAKDNKPWCITIEYTRENGLPEFKSYCDQFTIEMILSNEWQEQCKESMGQNIALITIKEEES